MVQESVVNQQINLLVVADEDDTLELLSLILSSAGYQVEIARSASQTFQKLQEKTYQLVVVEEMLPEVSGVELIQSIRQKMQIPMLLLTTASDSSLILQALESGADDYLQKPFERGCLLSRVRSIIRRSIVSDTKEVQTPGKCSVGQLVLDIKTYDVFNSGERVQLTPSEFKLLHALIENRGKVLSREKLIELVQGAGIAVIDRAIDTHIFGLRKKLGTHSEVVETVRGVGYRVSDTFVAS